MTDWWTAAIKAQRDLLDAQRKTLDASQRALGMADAAVKLQEAGRQAAGAQLKAWQAWAGLWGLGR